MLAALLCALTAGPLPAVDLSDLPLTVPQVAKPNILLTLDDSGSMDATYLPDAVNDSPFEKCFKYPGYNRQYYNPNVQYPSASNADGSAFPAAAITAAPANPFASDSPKVDLTRGVPVAGNPLGTNTTAYYTAAGGAVAPLDVCQGSTQLVAVPMASLTDAQRANFANWYSYHRTRMLAVRTRLSNVFSGFDGRYRVGLHLMNSLASVRVDDFTPCASPDCSRMRWFSTLLGAEPGDSTPLIAAYTRSGNYFSTGRFRSGDTAVPPVTRACQRNYVILVTDGMWNVNPAELVDADVTVPTLPVDPATGNPFTRISDPAAVGDLVANSSFPRPFLGPGDGRATLGDLAMRYWIGDLSGDLPNVLPAIDGDPATWQHVVTHAISLGIKGTLDATPANLARLRDGRTDWPVPKADTNNTLDDLWHATVNGHGRYFSVQDTTEFGTSMATLLNSVPTVAAVATLGLSAPLVGASDTRAFLATFDPSEWTGDVRAYALDANGLPDLRTPLWSAAASLATQKSGDRRIVTWSGTAGVAFRGGRLSAGQLARLTPPGKTGSAADPAKVVSYLRGARDGEFNAQTGLGTYRARQSVLGDIVDAAPLYVGPPNRFYFDPGYRDFAAAQGGRQPVVYAGANDGMLHAFAADTGRELWAYVPGILINEPNRAVNPPAPATSGLVNLTAREGFVHLQYANGTPVAGDVDFAWTLANGSLPDRAADNYKPAWSSLLVAGLNKGGRGYYALDVGQPVVSGEDDLEKRVKWEFTNPNLGFSYGKPVIVKTPGAGWVVLVASGYNNHENGGDGRGHLFVLNAATGALIKDFDTAAGDAGNPAGLAQISAWVERGLYDNTSTVAYGGDLLCNLWRFDFSGPVDTWPSPRRLARLSEASRATPAGTTGAAGAAGVAGTVGTTGTAGTTGTTAATGGSASAAATASAGATASPTADGPAQPVTTAPELSRVDGKLMVFVATGRMLGSSDLQPGAAAGMQSIYGLVDDHPDTPITRSDLGARTATPAAAGTAGTPLTGTRGWVIDMARPGERAVTDGVIGRGVFALVTVAPGGYAVCTAQSESFIYAIDVATGQLGLRDSLGAGFAGGVALQLLGDRLQGVAVVSDTSGVSPSGLTPKVVVFKPAPPAAGFRRLLWREVMDP